MTDDNDLGGEPACWAHLVDDLDDAGDVAGGSAGSTVDLTELGELTGAAAQETGGVVWSLPHGGDLDGNVVWLRPGDAIDEHVNDEVDVLVVVWSGAGELRADGCRILLRAGIVAQIDRGARRSLRAGAEGMTYLSVHRRRDGLTISRR